MNDIFDKHPYILSMLLSTVILTSMFFYAPASSLSDAPEKIENLEFVQLDKVLSPKRVTKKKVSTKEGDPQNENEQRAKGNNSSNEALDLSLYPNIVPPTLLGKLKKDFPISARDANVEATVLTRLVIDKKGKVINVRVLGIKLSKQLPLSQEIKINDDIKASVRRMYQSARFSVTIHNGKATAAVKEFLFRFRLNK